MGTPALAQSGADDLAGLQGQLVRTASVIRSIERKFQDIDAHLLTLTKKQTTLEADYNTRREKMAGTLAALTRMGRTPLEAVLVRPGGPLQAARTSMLLSASFPVIQAEAQSFKNLLLDLQKTKTELAEKSAQAKTTRAELQTSHQKLSALLEARRTSGTAIIWQEDAQKVAALSRAARSLRDFLSELDDGSDARARQDAFFATLPDGEGLMPVSGIIRVGYGQRDTIGEASKGIRIETLAGAVVVAPLGGVVRYIGPFKGYGNIVIIAHKGKYHSLLAGLDKITVEEGQTIVSGEPIAILDSNDVTNPAGSTQRKTVYYELRYNGQAVNPSRKLPELG